MFCPGDSPRHAFHRAVRKHFGLREFALGFRLSSWESDGTFRVQLELFDSEARPCGETHDVAFTKSTFEGRAVYDLRVDFHDGAVVDWPMIEKCASKR